MVFLAKSFTLLAISELYYNIPMGKHTLRYLDEQQHRKARKKKDHKSNFIKTHLEVIVAIFILLLAGTVTDIILFADEFFYINSCTLGYEVDCANVNPTSISIFTILMLLPIAFAIFAIIRAYQRKQKKSAIITAILAFIIVFSPLIIPGIYSARISQYDDTVILSIESSNNRCKLVGVTPKSDSTCQIYSGGVPFEVDDFHNNAQIAIKSGDDRIVVHLDDNLNIFNIARQNLHVCAYINGNFTASCRVLYYSNQKASVQEDTYYTYSYLKNKLTITPKQ